MGGHLNLDGGMLTLDGGTLTLGGGRVTRVYPTILVLVLIVCEYRYPLTFKWRSTPIGQKRFNGMGLDKTWGAQ